VCARLGLTLKNKKNHTQCGYGFFAFWRQGERAGGEEERFMSKIKMTFRGNFVGENQHYDY
jgi:hypothetical protein